MKTSPDVQAGPITPVKLTLDPAAFKAALTAVIPAGKIGWTTDDHWNLVTKLLPSLKDEAGKSVAISTALGNILKLIYKPTEDAEKDVLRQAFADQGCILDPGAESTLVMLFSAAQFADFLQKTNRPQTNEKFVLKDKTSKRGAKKDTFTSLLATGTPPPSATGSKQAEGEATASESADQPQQEPELAALAQAVKRGTQNL